MLSSLFILAACQPKVQLSLDKESMSIEMYATAVLRATVTEGFEVTAESSDVAVVTATVGTSSTSSGLITYQIQLEGKTMGEATVTVQVEGRDITKVAEITVIQPSPKTVNVTGTLEVVMGETQQLSATVTPTEAPQTITWSSSNTAVATVSNTGLVTGVSFGQVTITATSALATVKKAVTFNVILPDPTGITITGPAEVEIEGTATYVAVIDPELAPQGVDWSVSNTDIATIDNQGVVTGVAVGTVKVIATSQANSEIVSEKEITVIAPAPTSITLSGDDEIVVGGSTTLVATILPTIANPSLTWSSSNTSVANVNQNGLVTGVGNGTTVIRATSSVDQDVYGEMTITVEGVITMDYILIDPAAATMSAGESITYRGVDYFVGMNAFASPKAAEDAIEDGSTVYIKAGVYTEAFSIKQSNVTLLGPNAGINPVGNLDGRIDEAEMTGRLSFTTGIENTVIDGIKFSGGAQIYSTVPVKDLLVQNVYFTSSSVDAAQGVVFFGLTNDELINENIEFLNSVFDDSRNLGFRGIRINNGKNLTIKDNYFYAFFDVIRLEGSGNSGWTTPGSGAGAAGTIIIDGNQFENTTQYPILFGRYTATDVQITNNSFHANRGGGSYGHINLLNPQYSDTKMVVNIMYNTFENSPNFHTVRIQRYFALTRDQIEFNVNWNMFMTAPEFTDGTRSYIHKGNDDISVGNHINGANNYYNVSSLLPSYFFGTSTYEPYFLDIEAFATALAYAQLAETGDDVLLVGDSSLVPGKTVHATIADALAAASAGDTIFLLPGTHAGDVTINKNNITITSLNGAVNPNDPSEIRFAEAVITGKITLASQLKGFGITGINFKDNAQIVNTLGPVGTASATTKNLEGFNFENNVVETGLASGQGFIHFVEAGSSYSYDLVFKNNYFTTSNASTTMHSIVYIDNHVNLTLTENVFEDVVGNGFYVNDVTKGMSGDTYVINNLFKNISKSGFRVNWMSPLIGTQGTVHVFNNVFENIGEYGLYFERYNNTDIYKEIKVYYNQFTNVNVGVYFHRVHANANITIHYNKFFTVANTYYVQNGMEPTTSSPAPLNAMNNFYVVDGVGANPASDKFAGTVQFATEFTDEALVPVYTVEGEIVIMDLEIAALDTRLFVGENYTLELVYTPEDTNTRDVVWSSSNASIISVNAEGVITAHAVGIATITATSTRRSAIVASITIEAEIYSDAEVRYDGSGVLNVGGELPLTTFTYPDGTAASATYTSLNTAVATISGNKVVGVSAGEAIIQANVGGKVVATITVVVHVPATAEVDPIQFIIDAHIASVLARDITTFGNTTRVERTYGAVSNVWFGNLVTKVNLMPTTNQARTETKLTAVEFVTIHDTGNNSLGATAQMHTNYLNNQNPAASWHYTVDQNEVHQHLPLDEVGWHAGDGTGTPFVWIDTGVTATVDKPTITITTDGFYAFNGVKSTIAAPLIGGNIADTSKITPSGLITKIQDGKYFMTPTYYNSTYGVISNRGGNLASIGIESCVDAGADLYATWQNLARLVADLLVEFDLGLDRVVTHNHFSGKNCPQTLRTAQLLDQLHKMIAFEVELQTTYQDYTFTFVSNNPSIVNNEGKVITQPKLTTEVSYTVTVTNGSGYNESITLFSTIPGTRTLG